jgi:hypothetical protein
MRAEPARPGREFLSPEQYDQLFTMHGTIMLLFATPDAGWCGRLRLVRLLPFLCDVWKSYRAGEPVRVDEPRGHGNSPERITS